MKCQKCGAELVPGHLYCDICGAEFQIVPNFEPEIENSIAESLSDIRETMEDTISVKVTKLTSKVKTLKVPSFSLIFVFVFVISLILFLGYTKYTNSITYQNNQAIKAINKQDYYQASQIYEKIRKNNSNDATWYIKEAEIQLLMQQNDKAYNLAKSALQLEKNADKAYHFLIKYLADNANYIEAKQLLDRCPYTDICNEYWEYSCKLPNINYDSGSYNEALEISFEKGYEGTIYYSLDQNVPTTSSLKFEKPLKLGNGVHTITAIYENKYGIMGEPVTYRYDISSDLPMAPMVELSSGKYENAQMIRIDIEEGTRVFYTTDLTQPTMESMEYTAPIPMPLGESRFNFIAYSETGVASSVTHRNYMLNMKTNLTMEDAEVKLVQKLISNGHILDQNGAVSDRYGVFRYFYKFSICEADINYYVFEEHYMENQINNPLEHFYAIDVLYGNVYKLISDGNGNFTRIDF